MKVLSKTGPARYAGVIVVNLFALLLVALLDPHSQIGTYVALMVAVMITAWLGGRLAGLFAVALATWVGNYPLLAGQTGGSTFAEDFLRLAGLVVACLLVSGVTSLQSARWESEKKLQELKNRLQWLDTMLESHPTPFLLSRCETGKLVYANQAAARFSQASSPFGPLPGANGSGNAQPLPPAALEMSKRVIAGEVIDGELLEWSTPERTLVLSVSARRLASAFGEPDVCVFSYQDVTSLHDLANQRAELVSSVSHSLRTPLTATLLNLEVLLDGTMGSLDPRQSHYLETSYKQVHDLSRLVSDLLMLSKLEHGGVAVQPDLLHIGSLIRFVVDSLEGRADQRGVKLETRCTHSRGEVHSDGRQVTLVVTELIENAIKYSPEGGRVQVITSDDDSELRIDVIDQGPGIDPAESEKVFDAFYRGKAAVDCLEPGTGLGLGIARKTMRLLGGDVTVVPQQGGGACLRITLPRERKPA